MPSADRLEVSVSLVKAGKEETARSALSKIAVTSLPIAGVEGGQFFSYPSEPTPPRWARYVELLLNNSAALALESQAPSGLLWIPRAGKIFVFAFGHAHARISANWLEPDFGKKVALSITPQGQVVEIQAEQVFARWHTANERAPSASAVREFGYQADRDLVSAVEGVPSPKYLKTFGGKVRGSTSLKFGMDFSRLIATLDEIAERFDSNDYRRIWPQIDFLTRVSDADLRQKLDSKLDAILAGKRPGDQIVFAAPTARTGERPYPQHFVIGRMSKIPATAPFLLFGNWEAYLAAAKLTPSVATAKDNSVHLLNEEKERIETVSVYECFGTEVSVSGQSYVLSSGSWYEAKRKFVDETNAQLANLSSPPHNLTPWKVGELEGDYNERAVEVDKSLTLFDKKLVYLGGGQSKFEFCDLMHLKSKTLYFVKQPSGSASVSHLLEQTRRTVENFFSTDPSFRSNLSAGILKRDSSADVSWLSARPKNHEWNLCLVLMGKDAKELAFFARCGVALLVRQLTENGHQVSFLKV